MARVAPLPGRIPPQNAVPSCQVWQQLSITKIVQGTSAPAMSMSGVFILQPLLEINPPANTGRTPA